MPHCPMHAGTSKRTSVFRKRRSALLLSPPCPVPLSACPQQEAAGSTSLPHTYPVRRNVVCSWTRTTRRARRYLQQLDLPGPHVAAPLTAHRKEVSCGSPQPGQCQQRLLSGSKMLVVQAFYLGCMSLRSLLAMQILVGSIVSEFPGGQILVGGIVSEFPGGQRVPHLPSPPMNTPAPAQQQHCFLLLMGAV